MQLTQLLIRPSLFGVWSGSSNRPPDARTSDVSFVQNRLTVSDGLVQYTMLERFRSKKQDQKNV